MQLEPNKADHAPWEGGQGSGVEGGGGTCVATSTQPTKNRQRVATQRPKAAKTVQKQSCKATALNKIDKTEKNSQTMGYTRIQKHPTIYGKHLQPKIS